MTTNKFFIVLLFSVLSLAITGSNCREEGPCTTCPPSIDDTTANPRKLIENAGYPDWSPTGERIAFVRDSMICLYYFADKRIEQITIGTEPNFSPDGAKITFERNKKIYWIDLQSKQETYLTEGITPNWSANGKWIAFANKNASRLLTDGTIIYGSPSPDSSLYYYDLESNIIKRIVITNYDSLWIGDKLSLFFPTWGMNDSIIFFSSEAFLWKVRRSGGIAVGYTEGFPSNKNLYKELLSVTIGSGGQQRWNESTRKLIYFSNDETGFHTYTPRVHIYNYNTGFGFLFQGTSTDPCWSIDGKRFLYYNDNSNSIWIYKFTP